MALRCIAAMLATIATPAGAQPLPARWPRAPLTEVARAAVGAGAAFERHGLAGRGSLLCLVDTGADASHRALAGPEGMTRVRWVLDTFAEPRGRFESLEARFRGAVWRGDEPGLPGDPHGHGTAMASIAAGEGGLAPEAELVVVRAYESALGGFPDGAVVDGVRFCRAIAEEDPSLDATRMVVLLSLGGHDGAHDGEGAFERALAIEARAVPIVVAAGNDGARAVYATGRLFAGERAMVELRVPRSDRPDAELALTVRGGAGLAIEAPDGSQAPLAGVVDLPGARIEVEPVEGEPGVVRARIAARGGALGSGTYRLRIGGPSRFEVWLAGARLGPTFLAPSLGGAHVRSDEVITIPATSDALIAVGAVVSRTRVATDLGELSMEGASGERASYSAIGPGPSGVPKPDLVAPGGWILAALSGDVRDGDPENLAGGALARYRGADGRIAVRGTSAAAAVVAGALLLALELDPARALDARALLVASARGEGAWSPELGAGVLDVERLLAAWGGARDALPTEGALAATRPLMPSDRALWIAALVRGASGAPAGSWLDLEMDGDAYRWPLEHGTARGALPVPRVTIGSSVVVRATTDGVRLPDLAVPVTIERGARGEVSLGGGGCAVGRAPPPRIEGPSSSAGLVLLIALAALLRRGRS